MKKNFTLILLALTSIALSQIPTGYYNSATGNGYTLKTQLKQIIDDNTNGLSPEYLHNPQTYNSLDVLYNTSDKDIYYENDNTILDIYSENPSGTDPYNFTYGTSECGSYTGEGDCYNKEHVIPQSAFSSAMPMYSDGHHLLPTDGRVNGFRSNYPFGIVGTSLVSQSGISNPTQNGSKLGNGANTGISTGYNGIVFEPIDEFKGDIARIYFYFVTRYENQVSSWSSYAMFDGSTTKVIADPFLSILLSWHLNDPVSQKEIDRNNAIFEHQNNRNPFVDHPEYVTQIWSAISDTTPPTVPTNLTVSNETSNSLYVSWTASTDNIGILNYNVYVDGVYFSTVSGTNCTISGLNTSTTYSITVVAYDASGNNSGPSSAINGTTLAPTSTVTELFFSEYMEGSSSNKALEIANFTNVTISLDIYTLKLSTNGSGTWTSPIVFPAGAQISSNDVYVITNGSLAVCTSVSDYANNNATAFNGNDVVGLFKNDILIDIIGTLGNSADFAKDVTLVRKSTVLAPNTTFTTDEWNSFATNTCDNLGQHAVTLNTSSFDLSNSFIYPNPSSTGNFAVRTDANLTSILVYNINGQIVQEINNPSNINGEYQINDLKTGFYMVQLNSESNLEFKKIIVN